MMTTNKLTKTFASGSLAIGIAAVAGIVNAPSAHALTGCGVDITFSAWTGGQALTCGDKTFTYVSNTGLPTAPEVPGEFDLVEADLIGGDYFFAYDFLPGSNVAGFQLVYDVTITDPNFSFSAVDLDSTVGGFDPPAESLTATFVGGTAPVVLQSINGSSSQAPVFGHPKTLRVTNDYTSNGGEIFSFENSFRQTKVPEPGTILGLLAVGGLGLVSRLKRQK
jgi:hypothetical protein